MKLYKDKDTLERLYTKYESAYKVADELKVNYKTIYTWLDKLGIDIIKTSQGARKHVFNYSYFKEIDTEDKAYWLGFIMADGYIHKVADKHSYMLQIRMKSSDKDHLGLFQGSIGSKYELQHRRVKKINYSTLKLSSTAMCHDLMSYGVRPKEHHQKVIPKIDRNLIRDYMRGYFDRNSLLHLSELSNDPSWSLRIPGGDFMLQEIKTFLRKNGIPSNTYKRNESNLSILIVESHSDIRKIYDLLYKDSHVSMKSMREKFKTFMHSVPFKSDFKVKSY